MSFPQAGKKKELSKHIACLEGEGVFDFSVCSYCLCARCTVLSIKNLRMKENTILPLSIFSCSGKGIINAKMYCSLMLRRGSGKGQDFKWQRPQ